MSEVLCKSFNKTFPGQSLQGALGNVTKLPLWSVQVFYFSIDQNYSFCKNYDEKLHMFCTLVEL